MKTFKDLEFKQHKHGSFVSQARLDFDNGYGVSVIFGEMFYIDGIETYELAMFKDGHLFYHDITDGDVVGYINRDRVTGLMKQIQELPKEDQ